MDRSEQVGGADASVTRVSALVPVYSETTLLLESLARLKRSLGEVLHEVIIVVSPKSTLECLELCQNLAREDALVRTFVQTDRPGIGWAYREAIPHLTGTHGLLISSDLETNPDDAATLVQAAQRTGADVVCASRWLPGGGFSRYDPLKLVLNWGYNLIFRWLYRTAVHDITFGYKLVRAELLRGIRWEGGGHEFCAEVLLKPLRLGCTVAEVPTKWVKRAQGESKMSFARNFKFATVAWRIRRARPESFLEGTDRRWDPRGPTGGGSD